MSVTLQSYCRFVSIIDGEEKKGGSVEKPVSLSVDGEIHEKIASIATAGNSTMFSAEVAFNYMYAVSDFDVRLAFTDTAANTFSLTLKGTGVAKSYGVPLPLGSIATVSGETISSIVAHNDSGSTAKVRLIAIK